MADFNFGFVGEAMTAAQHSAAGIDLSPIETGSFDISDFSLTDFIRNRIDVLTVEGGGDEFVWSQRWGNSKTRVAE